ncbi:MAG: PfkB family carbohydrate kinase [Sulfolobales archaeon]
MIYLISSFTEDIIDLGGEKRKSLGGPALYGGYTLHILGNRFIIETSLDSYLREILEREYPQLSKVIRINRSCEKHFIFRHFYRASRRISYLDEEGCEIDFDLESFEKSGISFIIISPVYREISLYNLERITKIGIPVAVDLQGFVRYTDNDKIIRTSIGIDLLKKFYRVSLIHAGVEEVEELSRDPLESLDIIARITKAMIVVISMGRRGFLSRVDGEGVYHVEALMGGVSGDETGCGDILLTSLLSSILKGFSISESLRIASFVAGLRVLRGFPFHIDLEEIIGNIDKIGIRKIS